VKSAILKNEMKHDRCANAYDCYLKLTRDLTKNGQEDVNQKWLKWERNLDQKILQKTALKTNRTFIGLGTEHTEEYDRLTSLGNQHIIYTDRKSIPDMAPIVGTQSLYQLQGDSNKVSAGVWNLHTAVLPCSCPPCRFNPSNRTACVYKHDRDLKTNIVSLKTINDDNNDDTNGINKLTVPQLREELRTRGLKLNGNKPELMARLVHHLENEEALDDDGIIESYVPSTSDTTVVNSGTADATVVNGDATVLPQPLITDATVTNGCTADATVVNGGATSSLSTLITNTTTTLNPSATVINGGTDDTTVVNGGATSTSNTDSISTLTIDATVINGGTADVSIVSGDAIGTVAAMHIYSCESDIHSLTVAQIKEQLRARGLRLSGNKALLKERLIGAIVVNVSSAPAALPNCNISE